jgi:hypothetical protein
MRPKHHEPLSPDDVDRALAALDADDLREIVRGLLPELAERARSRAVAGLIERAARRGSGWTPAAVSDAGVEEVLAFVEEAASAGHAEPFEMDEHLQTGTNAFLSRDYAAAHGIFGALLRPLADGEIDLGQEELPDEVLGVDPADCAARYVVAAYMLTEPENRAEAVWRAIDEMRWVGHFWRPLEELERAAAEPLPGFEEFLPRWRDLVAEEAEDERRDGAAGEACRWLREVVRRLEGADGLARIARSSRNADDLRAWCRHLVEARDWKGALRAFDEAATLVTEPEYHRADFLDGAALAARELGREDVPRRLERAWREEPTLLRLRRWLGTTDRPAALRKRAAAALAACPEKADRQRAFLHLLAGDFASAAALLARAPGLGWSGGEHPGHLLFPLFAALVRGQGTDTVGERPAPRRLEPADFDLPWIGDDDGPRLAAPPVEELLRRAGLESVPDAARQALLAAMRQAAERRVDGVTDRQRRNHYGHAAELVAACVECDPSDETARWLASVRTAYRRYPAFRAALDRALAGSGARR